MSDETTVETTEEAEKAEVQTEVKAEAKTYPESYVKKIHTENAARRKEAEELRNKLKEYEDKELAQETDLKKKIEALEKRDKQREAEYGEKLTASERRYVRAEVRASAIREGIIDPDDVNSMDLSDLRVDDEGNVSGVAELIAASKERKPHWFKSAKSEEKPPEKIKPVVTPGRKDGEATVDYRKVGDSDFRDKMRSMGVNI